MDISGVVPLDENSLLESAFRSSGLSDFGADDWREPFRVFIKALEAEADLNLMGRIRTRSEILMLLEARLQIEETYKQHPEIENEKIVQPFVVIGQGRSGTSFLFNVLAANPENGALRQWEAMFPCPPPEQASYTTDPRIEKADKLVTQAYRVTPTMASMFEFGANVPMEDCAILAINFMSTSWMGQMGQVASYDAFMATQDITPGLRYHQRVLKLLQWKNPRTRWVLKDPIHLDRLAAILTVYPDACFIWPHRDPVRALASTVSLVGTAHWGRSDHVFKNGAYAFVTDPMYSAQRLDNVIEQIESGSVAPKQIYNLLYKNLVGNTIATLEAMYRHFGIILSNEGRAGMQRYLTDHPREQRPPHKFNVGSEAVVTTARQAYQRYQDYFGIPSD